VALNVVHPVTRVAAGVLGSDTSLLGRLHDLSAPVWLVLAWVVVVGTVLPFAVELVALRHLSATVVTMVAMLEPIGVNALGWAWFSESLGPVEVAGGVAVVAGIVLAQSSRHPAVVAEPPHLT
jgi:drug/metabolite transporter (DMT)-like permease